MRRHALPSLLLFAAIPFAQAQRADSSAVRSADDAFGVSLGRETIGIYNSGSVRGFSPTAAGNVRIDGLYFDPIWSPNARIRGAGSIRVGLSSQGYPFPAPTGIVDYLLRRPGSGGTLAAGLDDAGGRYLEMDAGVAVSGRLSLGGGLSLSRSGYTNGTDGKGWNAGASLWWRPAPTLELGLFSAYSHQGDDEMSPQLSPLDGRPPAIALQLPQGRFAGPSWVDYDGVGLNHGAVARWQLSPQLTLRAGLFHSGFKDASSFAHLLLDLRPDGSARRLIVADPATSFRSNSGELRAVYEARGTELRQQWLLNLSGRARERRNGGSASQDFGATRLGEPFEPPEPAWQFGAQTQDRVRQHTWGAAWGAQWAAAGQRRAEWMLGLQQTVYRKTVLRPGQAAVQRRDAPLLFSLSGAWHLAPALALYASRSRGLEESGTAPDTANNRGQALPAIRTQQWDAGLRWQASAGLRLVAGAFEVRKPYFNLDAANLFTGLGEVSHRGLELSLSGQPSPRLSLVAGAVLMRPQVQGEAVQLGRVGPRPVGQAERQLRLNLGWTPEWLAGATLDLGLAHTGRMPATRDNRVELPSLTLLDAGLRWPLRLVEGEPVVLRLSASNLLNRRAFELRGAGSYAERPGRLLSASLARDF